MRGEMAAGGTRQMMGQAVPSMETCGTARWELQKRTES
jgi:hypothetical protein